jgi:hypothetical protein
VILDCQAIAVNLVYLGSVEIAEFQVIAANPVSAGFLEILGSVVTLESLEPVAFQVNLA